MPVAILEKNGGAALDTIQIVNSAVSVAAAAWGSTIPTTFSAADRMLTLPTIALADVGKSVTVHNSGTFAFTLAIATGTITSAIGLIVNPGSVFEIKAINITTAVVANSNAAQQIAADNGTVALTANTSLTVAANSVATAINAPGLAFTAKETASYVVSLKLHGNQTVAANNLTAALYDALAPSVALPNSETLIAIPGTAGEYSGSGSFDLDAIAGRTYQVKFFSTAGITTAALINNANGRSTLTWQKLSGGSVSSIAGATAGDRKWCDLLTDHGINWILLDGRLKSSLTAAQQAVATSLGYGTNIPDMRGRMPLGSLPGTYPLNTTGGSFVIAQNQLPNTTIPYQESYLSSASSSGTAGAGSISIPRSGGSSGLLVGWTGNGQVSFSNTLGTFNTSSINGNVTQQNHIPSYGTGNWFVWLGSSVNTLTLSSPMVGGNGTVAGASGTVPVPGATDDHKFLKGNATYGDAIGKISTTNGISALTAGTVTTLYTVSVGRSLNITHIAIKTNTVTGTVTTNPVLSIGSNASTHDNLMATTAMIGVTTTGRVFNHPVFGAAPIFPAGSIISIQIDTAQAGATALTYDVELYGVLN